MKAKDTGRGLRASIENNELVIRIEVDTLANAFES